MAYLDPKGKGTRACQKPQSCPGVWGGAAGGPRDMAKAGLLEAQSPEDGSSHPPERRLEPAPALQRLRKNIRATSGAGSDAQ